MASYVFEPRKVLEGTVFDEDYAERFTWTEYLSFAALLTVSLCIGVFYGCFGKKNRSNEEFLMAGRSMPVFPVTLSVICSYVSAITLLGNPVEIYFYGLQSMMIMGSVAAMGLCLTFIYIPVYFNLQLTSAFQYFELRFDRRVRRVISVSQIVHGLLYMPTAVWGPAIALEEVAGINARLTSAIIFLVCIAYSSLGGLKAVLWTDAVQALVMFASLISVFIIGVNEVGGLDIVWKRAQDTDRTQVLNLDTDLRTRYTFWTGTIAAYFTWMPLFAATQAQVQRYLSVPTLRQARQVVWISLIGLMTIVALGAFIGLTVYAKYYQCDPITLGRISSSDQLVPFFVMDVIGDIPVLPGLFVAGLTAGSLSSVSSTLNALAAITTEDFVKVIRPNLSDVKLGVISKVISAIGGLIAFGLVFVISAAGNILPFASLLIGVFISPTLGCFTLGMIFPWSNWVGVLMSLVPSVGLALFLGIGSILAGNDKKLPNQRLFLDQSGCYLDKNATTFATTTLFMNSRANTDWKDEEWSPLIKLYSLSYMWQPMIPCVNVIILGLLFSLIAARFKKFPRVKASYISPPLLSLWKFILGEKRLARHVDLGESPVLMIRNFPMMMNRMCRTILLGTSQQVLILMN